MEAMDASRGGVPHPHSEDALVMLVLFLFQWVNRRNAAALAVMEAVSVMPFLHQNVSTAVTLLAGGILHDFVLGSLAVEEMGRTMDRRRRQWVLEHSGGVWKDLQRVGGEHDKVFVRFCRLPRPLFFEVLARISPHIQCSPTNFRLPISAGQKFACALMRWATGGYYRQSSHSLGMGLASALCSNEDVADTLIREYGHLLRFPTGQRLEDVQNDFERKGFPGAVRISPLYVQATSGRGVLAEGGAMLHGGRHIGRYMLGDQGYPLLPWLMTPFGRFAVTSADRAFDVSHSAVRSCIERTFGRLKAVWRNFIRRHICNLKTVCKEFMAVCILHNLMIDHDMEIDLALMKDISDSDGDDHHRGDRRRRRRRRRFNRHMSNLNIEVVLEDDPTYGGDLAKHVRASLVEHVRHHSAVHGASAPCPWQQWCSVDAKVACVSPRIRGDGERVEEEVAVADGRSSTAVFS
ncbi:hypothetical protein CBR_g17797 [Chara braunii]|uniref:DDE Tnp4 domain-containing protein n=1 Tax=Chara braunii TaxID=69332 RepID=A0A388KVJ3_CHABU|nr:hypothetical protein CBR_g17797 [Chara braunii]|eukprot:GBG74086.1 hypothetical protein CBR_g17797 [Chara braunii]